MGHCLLFLLLLSPNAAMMMMIYNRVVVDQSSPHLDHISLVSDFNTHVDRFALSLPTETLIGNILAAAFDNHVTANSNFAICCFYRWHNYRRNFGTEKTEQTQHTIVLLAPIRIPLPPPPPLFFYFVAESSRVKLSDSSSSSSINTRHTLPHTIQTRHIYLSEAEIHFHWKLLIEKQQRD